MPSRRMTPLCSIARRWTRRTTSSWRSWTRAAPVRVHRSRRWCLRRPRVMPPPPPPPPSRPPQQLRPPPPLGHLHYHRHRRRRRMATGLLALSPRRLVQGVSYRCSLHCCCCRAAASAALVEWNRVDAVPPPPPPPPPPVAPPPPPPPPTAAAPAAPRHHRRPYPQGGARRRVRRFMAEYEEALAARGLKSSKAASAAAGAGRASRRPASRLRGATIAAPAEAENRRRRPRRLRCDAASRVTLTSASRCARPSASTGLAASWPAKGLFAAHELPWDEDVATCRRDGEQADWRSISRGETSYALEGAAGSPNKTRVASVQKYLEKLVSKRAEDELRSKALTHSTVRQHDHGPAQPQGVGAARCGSVRSFVDNRRYWSCVLRNNRPFATKRSLAHSH